MTGPPWAASSFQPWNMAFFSFCGAKKLSPFFQLSRIFPKKAKLHMISYMFFLIWGDFSLIWGMAASYDIIWDHMRLRSVLEISGCHHFSRWVSGCIIFSLGYVVCPCGSPALSQGFCTFFVAPFAGPIFWRRKLEALLQDLSFQSSFAKPLISDL